MKQSSSIFIYDANSEEEDEKENKYKSSQSNKSDEIKKNEQETEISQSRLIQNCPHTELIRISPSQKNIFHSNETQQLNFNEIINFDEELQHQNQQNHQYIYEELTDSPVKLMNNSTKFPPMPSTSIKLNNATRYENSLSQLKKQQQKFQMQNSIYSNLNLLQSQKSIIESQSQNNDSDRIINIKRKKSVKLNEKKRHRSKKDVKKQQTKIQHQRIKQQQVDAVVMKKEFKQQQESIKKPHQKCFNEIKIMQQFTEYDSQEQNCQNDEVQVNYNSSSEQEAEGYSEQEQMIEKTISKSSKNPIKVIAQSNKNVFVEGDVQALIMRQIPKGLRISFIFQISSKYFGMSTTYNLIFKDTQQIVLSAKKQHFSFTTSQFIISSNKNYITKRKDNRCYLGSVQGNFTGTEYKLFKRKCLNEEEENDSQREYMNNLIEVVTFDENILGFKGIKNTQIIKLNRQKLSKRDIINEVCLEDVFEKGQNSKLLKLQSKKPIFDPIKKRYNINFKGKVSMPSSKNLIMERLSRINPSKQIKSQQCLLMAKQSQNKFLVQVSHPFSIYQAFGACLANNDTKLFVS